MKLQDKFYISDFTYSSTAVVQKIDNTVMTGIQLTCLIGLHKMLWFLQEALVTKFQKPVILSINSAFRSQALNDYFVKTIGASKTSQHMDGQAADLSVIGITLEELFDALKEFAQEGMFTFGQVILEYGKHPEISANNWCHVSTTTDRHKNQFMTHNSGEAYISVKI